MRSLLHLISVRLPLLAIFVVWHLLADSSVAADQQLSFLDALQELSAVASSRGKRVDGHEVKTLFYDYSEKLIVAFEEGEAGDKELAELFDNASRALFRGYQRPIAELLSATVHEMHQRAITSPFIAQHSLYDHPAQVAHVLFVNGRFVDLAAEIERNFPGIVDMFPIVINEPKDFDHERPAVLLLNADEEASFDLLSLEVNQGAWFVAVVHPDCYFSHQAMLWLEANEYAVKHLLPEKSVWLSSQSRTRDLSRLRQWNLQSELINLAISYRDASWPEEILLAVTPTFYALRNGKIESSVAGWPSDEQSSKLISLLRSLSEADVN